MVSVDVTTLSTKGQVVIPLSMREDLHSGEKFAIIKDGHRFILKPLVELGKNFAEDIEFAKRTLASLERYGKGEFKEKTKDEFLAELEKW